jgi:hypothetical protein
MKDAGTVRCKTEFAVLAVAPTMVQKQNSVAATAISLAKLCSVTVFIRHIV